MTIIECAYEYACAVNMLLCEWILPTQKRTVKSFVSPHHVGGEERFNTSSQPQNYELCPALPVSCKSSSLIRPSAGIHLSLDISVIRRWFVGSHDQKGEWLRWIHHVRFPLHAACCLDIFHGINTQGWRDLSWFRHRSTNFGRRQIFYDEFGQGRGEASGVWWEPSMSISLLAA